MTYLQILSWVNDPSRTLADLVSACTGLGLATTGALGTVRNRILTHIASQPDLTAVAPWSPPGTSVPVPVPVPTPTRRVPTWLNWTNAVIVAVVVFLLWLFSGQIKGLGSELVDLRNEIAASQNQPAGSGRQSFVQQPAGSGQQSAASATTGNTQSVVVVSGDHWGRLADLDPVFRSSGWQAWLQAGGISWQSIGSDARQVEEETSPASRILVAGVQVRDGVGINVPYPACVTTDDPSEVTVGSNTRQHQPDLRNPSVLYTNVVAQGTITIWADCSNWGQLSP